MILQFVMPLVLRSVLYINIIVPHIVVLDIVVPDIVLLDILRSLVVAGRKYSFYNSLKFKTF